MPWWKRTLVLLIITLLKERGILQTRLTQLVDATFSYYKQCLFSISRSYLGNNFNIDRKKKNKNKNKTNKKQKQKQKQKQNYLSCFLDIHRDTISLFKSIRLLQYLSVVGVRVVSS
jgi:hypothetical protein